MPTFDKHSRGTSTMQVNRLETASTAGYRVGMSSSGVIGRKLGAVYSVDSHVPCEMNTLLSQLQSKLVRQG